MSKGEPYICRTSHNTSSPPSNKALAILQSALSSPYPRDKPSAPPLRFDLEVIENKPPTADQVKTILSYLPAVKDSKDPHHVANLISADPSAPSLSDRPHSAEGLVRLAGDNPNAVKWPIVVDWTGGRASVGDIEGVKDMLEILRKKRDGEIKEEEDYKPKGWFS
ncbi:hypothetical protein EW146_g1906 [Bondarzewia mesenterica]|uniref:Thioredoxin-like fold domain-containing protein n=1 Tax=Bondarzewia mesenterica TaxID=1095465 RepID=A0A4S4M2C8_9AGAM|nr:hypothetical protein EW146_g1906 [Bondarzewia mesenterica]